MTAGAAAIDVDNVALFGRLAADWWNPDGSSRLLHRINPVRLAYLRDAALRHFALDPRARRPLTGLTALDVGCGAGLATEPIARMGAAVTGLDAAAESIAVAVAHAASQALTIDYRCQDIVALAEERPLAFDLVTMFEVIEHVPDVPRFLHAVARLLRPGGLLIFSTPNRTPLSYAVLIAGAERLVGAIPDGGHDWKRFLTPEELTADLASAGLRVTDTRGLGWNPARGFALGDDRRVNYIGSAIRP